MLPVRHLILADVTDTAAHYPYHFGLSYARAMIAGPVLQLSGSLAFLVAISTSPFPRRRFLVYPAL
jgi:hypothetical protein